MATPSPRKFQEKIALLQQKEAEGKIAYDNIMNEVQGLRMHPKSSGQPKGQQLLPPQAQPSPFQQPPPQHASRPPQSGSLPDFSINLPDQGRVPECYVQGPLQGAMQDLNNLQNQVYSGVPHQRVSVASQIRSHQHISPHLGNSPAYPVLLSPPHASESLLRSNSDSSLHQNLLHGGKAANNRKVSAPVEVGRMDPGLGVNLYGHMRHSQELQNRPKSGCELTHPSEITDVRGPRINHVQRSPNIPIPTTITNTGGAGPGGGGGVGTLPNTGSLPDLTQVQYLQPMNTPIPDTDLNTISPGSARLGTTFPTGVLGDPYSSGQASPRGTSPGPSPSVMRKKPQKPYQTTQTNHRGAHHSQNKGMTVDNSTIVDPHLANSGLNLFGQPLSPSGSHPPSPNQLSFMDYRNPVSPQLSPRSSPGPCHTLQTGGLGSYSSNSPSDSRSAPPSPSAPQASPASSPGVTISKPFTYNEYHTHAQTNQLNQQFEQCKMIDNSPVPASSYASSGSSNVHPQAGLLDISVEGNGFFSGAPSSSPGVPQGCPIPTSQAHQQPTGPPPPYPQTSTTQAHQQLQQTPQQQQEQHQQQQQQQEQQQQQQQSQQQQTSQSQQQSQQQQQPQHHQQPSPTHPQHITQSPNHHPHHPPSPVQSISSHAPPSPAQDPLSPQSHNHNMQHPQTPQTPQTPTFITPQVVVTIPPGEGTEDSLLQENISTWDMFASSPNPYEEGSFESSILDHMRCVHVEAHAAHSTSLDMKPQWK